MAGEEARDERIATLHHGRLTSVESPLRGIEVDGEEGGTTSQAFVGCRSPGGDRALAIPFSRQRWIVSSPNGMIVWYRASTC